MTKYSTGIIPLGLMSANHNYKSKFRLMYIEDWERVFKQDKMSDLFTVFKDWNEYFKYKGDYHNVP